MCATACVRRCHISEDKLILSTIYVLGVKLRPSVLSENTFTCWASHWPHVLLLLENMFHLGTYPILLHIHHNCLWMTLTNMDFSVFKFMYCMHVSSLIFSPKISYPHLKFLKILGWQAFIIFRYVTRFFVNKIIAIVHIWMGGWLDLKLSHKFINCKENLTPTT